MKKIICLLLISMSIIFGQTTPENIILLLDGGQTKIDFTFYWHMLSGGQNIGFNSAEPWDIWSNPASLITFKNSYLSVGIGPAILASVHDVMDVDAEIKSQVMEKIKD